MTKQKLHILLSSSALVACAITGILASGGKSMDLQAELWHKSMAAMQSKGPQPSLPMNSYLSDEPTSDNAKRPTGILINGRELTRYEVDEIRGRYGVEPVRGDFWYDSLSGVYGAVGGPALGIMYPGHHFGPLDSQASSGDSEVFFNGRELTRGEAVAIAALFGSVPIPGRYWLLANGNIGIEGSPVAWVNLYVALFSGRSNGRGDNFWSSRFSAGNYYTDGSGNPSQGYVSVPGYGPVGHGFD